MTRATIGSLVTAASLIALASACTMKNQDAPPLTGPSELDQSIVVSVSPDLLPQDGASQSLVTVTARDANAAPIRNMSLRAETWVGGTPVDFGSLSARSIVTGSDGRATLVYTAPPSPAVSPDNFLIVSVVVTPLGTDFSNSSPRSASIRLVPQGVVIPPGDLQPAFTFTPTSPTDNQTVLFDASTSKGTIADYQWNFGDGDRASGVTASHQYDTPGTYVATLTIVDPFNRPASISKSIIVTPGLSPSAAFVFSPTNPRANQGLNFNASASRAPAGSSIVSYTWDFGDGSPRVTTGSAVISKSYAVPATYVVTLVVTDSTGKTATASIAVTVTP
jgi:PKD repeat protein